MTNEPELNNLCVEDCNRFESITETEYSVDSSFQLCQYFSSLFNVTWGYYDSPPIEKNVDKHYDVIHESKIDSDEKNVILLPGIAEIPDVFFNQLRFLSDSGFRSIAVELPPLKFLDDWVVAFEELLNALKLKEVHLIGSGLGARLTLLFAAMRPSRVKSVVICNGYLDCKSRLKDKRRNLARGTSAPLGYSDSGPFKMPNDIKQPPNSPFMETNNAELSANASTNSILSDETPGSLSPWANHYKTGLERKSLEEDMNKYIPNTLVKESSYNFIAIAQKPEENGEKTADKSAEKSKASSTAWNSIIGHVGTVSTAIANRSHLRRSQSTSRQLKKATSRQLVSHLIHTKEGSDSSVAHSVQYVINNIDKLSQNQVKSRLLLRKEIIDWPVHLVKLSRAFQRYTETEDETFFNSFETFDTRGFSTNSITDGDTRTDNWGGWSPGLLLVQQQSNQLSQMEGLNKKLMTLIFCSDCANGTYENVKEMRERLQWAESVILLAGGEFPYISRFDEFNDLMAEHFRKAAKHHEKSKSKLLNWF